MDEKIRLALRVHSRLAGQLRRVSYGEWPHQEITYPNGSVKDKHYDAERGVKVRNDIDEH